MVAQVLNKILHQVGRTRWVSQIKQQIIDLLDFHVKARLKIEYKDTSESLG